MISVALTGNFGSGKTTALEMFSRLGAKTIDSDSIVKKLYKKKQVKKKLSSIFGNKIFSKKFSVDREKIGKKIFSSKKKREKLEKIIHSLVFSEIRDFLKKNKIRKIVVAEIPLLFESPIDFFPLFDFVVTVKAKRKQMIERGGKKGFSWKMADLVVSAQLPFSKKSLKTDFVVDNSGTKSETREQVKKIMGILGKRALRIYSEH